MEEVCSRCLFVLHWLGSESLVRDMCLVCQGEGMWARTEELEEERAGARSRGQSPGNWTQLVCRPLPNCLSTITSPAIGCWWTAWLHLFACMLRRACYGGQSNLCNLCVLFSLSHPSFWIPPVFTLVYLVYFLFSLPMPFSIFLFFCVTSRPLLSPHPTPCCSHSSPSLLLFHLMFLRRLLLPFHFILFLQLALLLIVP